MIRALVESFLLATVLVAAVLHLNGTHGRPWAERIGFALTGAGALGEILELWRVLAAGSGGLVDLVLYAGLSLISIQVFIRHSMALERIRRFARETMRDELEDDQFLERHQLRERH